MRLISSGDSGSLPIHAVIVVQTGDGSEPALAKITKTASVISSYIKNDMEIGTPSLAAVVTVADEVRIAQDFSADPKIHHSAWPTNTVDYHRSEIHNRYTLTFAPPENQSAGYHKLSVSLRQPGDWRVHARTGYWLASKYQQPPSGDVIASARKNSHIPVVPAEE